MHEISLAHDRLSYLFNGQGWPEDGPVLHIAVDPCQVGELADEADALASFCDRLGEELEAADVPASVRPAVGDQVAGTWLADGWACTGVDCSAWLDDELRETISDAFLKALEGIATPVDIDGDELALYPPLMTPEERSAAIAIAQGNAAATVKAVTLSLVELYPDTKVAEERARNLLVALEYVEEEEIEPVVLWHELVDLVGLRVDRGSEPHGSAVKSATARALRAYVSATWSEPPTALEMFAALARLGVPRHTIRATS